MTYSSTNIGDDYMQSMMEPATQPAPTLHNRVSVEKLLIELCRSAFVALDNSEDRGGNEIPLQRSDVEAMSAALDKMDDLPDDQPGYTMGPAAKAEWFLLGKAWPTRYRVVCIGWETISKLATGEAVIFEDQQVHLIAADNLFGRDIEAMRRRYKNGEITLNLRVDASGAASVDGVQYRELDLPSLMLDKEDRS